MHLLRRDAGGEFSSTTFADGSIPAYAILSHTWAETAQDEVSFHDIEAKTGKSKAAWKKLELCADQAAKDGLQYFWIDSCCIDRKNAVELSEAINSMFKWYKTATRCYVYLSDVHIPKDGHGNERISWEPSFKKSRWMTRGWTLQELLGPSDITFFSAECAVLGSKLRLETLIHEATGIAKDALRGEPLSRFSVKERRSWAQNRTTTLAEDESYSLLGIFDVSMPPIYGEGKDRAFRRLEDEIHKSSTGNRVLTQLLRCHTKPNSHNSRTVSCQYRHWFISRSRTVHSKKERAGRHASNSWRTCIPFIRCSSWAWRHWEDPAHFSIYPTT